MKFLATPLVSLHDVRGAGTDISIDRSLGELMIRLAFSAKRSACYLCAGDTNV